MPLPKQLAKARSAVAVSLSLLASLRLRTTAEKLRALSKRSRQLLLEARSRLRRL